MDEFIAGLGYVSQLSLHNDCWFGPWELDLFELKLKWIRAPAAGVHSPWSHVRARLEAISKCSHCILCFVLHFSLHQPSIFLNEDKVSVRLGGFAPKKMNTELTLWPGYFPLCLEWSHLQLNPNNYCGERKHFPALPSPFQQTGFFNSQPLKTLTFMLPKKHY